MKAYGKTLLLIAALAVAWASVTAVASAAGNHRGPKAPRVLAMAVHADVNVIAADGKTKSSSWDKGEVTAVSSTSITLKRRDGKSVTLSITSETKIRARDGKIEVGNHALAISEAGKAVAILAAPGKREAKSANDRGRGGPPAAQIPRAAIHVDWKLIMPDGKTVNLALDKGDVTAASSSSVTLKRADGKSVTLSINDKTKVLKKDKAALAVGDKALAWSQDGAALVVAAGQPKQKG